MNIIDKLKNFLDSDDHIKWHNARQSALLLYQQRAEFLRQQTLHCIDTGLSELKDGDTEVIVSLTTFGKRLYDVYLTIESIMQGTVKPHRICLWISEDFRSITLPIYLQNQIKRGLEIEYCKDIRSYTKIIPAMKKYPDAAIITIDDDVLYEYDMVEKLVNAYKIEPKSIHANRIHRVKVNAEGKPLSYMDWKWCDNTDDGSSLNFLTGVGGVLYPPHCFHKEVYNEEVFLDICKYADDVWLYFMSLLSGRTTKKVYTHNIKGEDYIVNENPAEVGLMQQNTNHQECRNDVQIRDVMEHYGITDLCNVKTLSNS